MTTLRFLFVLLSCPLVLACGAASSIDEEPVEEPDSCAPTPSSSQGSCEGINLVPVLLCGGPNFVSPGGQMAFNLSVKNTGTEPSPAGAGNEATAWIGAYVISTDTEITMSDFRVGAFTTEPAIQPGDTWSAPDVANIPAELVPGTYYFGMILDPFNKVVETNEADNVIAYCSPLQVR